MLVNTPSPKSSKIHSQFIQHRLPNHPRSTPNSSWRKWGLVSRSYIFRFLDVYIQYLEHGYAGAYQLLASDCLLVEVNV